MLIVDLVKELSSRGFKVGTLKHSPHDHELDKPGKDSFLHRKAGSFPAAVATKKMMAVYMPLQDIDNPFDHISPLFSQTDIVIVEGYINGPGIKLEVWRKEAEEQPFIYEREDIAAVITDDDLETKKPVWPRKDVTDLADKIQKLADMQ